jgi:hypothetical protein
MGPGACPPAPLPRADPQEGVVDEAAGDRAELQRPDHQADHPPARDGQCASHRAKVVRKPAELQGAATLKSRRAVAIGDACAERAGAVPASSPQSGAGSRVQRAEVAPVLRRVSSFRVRIAALRSRSDLIGDSYSGGTRFRSRATATGSANGPSALPAAATRNPSRREDTGTAFSTCPAREQSTSPCRDGQPLCSRPHLLVGVDFSTESQWPGRQAAPASGITPVPPEWPRRNAEVPGPRAEVPQ